MTGNATGLVVTVDDDVPGQKAATVNINVDEDELARPVDRHHGRRRHDHGGSFTGAQIAGLVASGADEPVTVSLNAAIDC